MGTAAKYTAPPAQGHGHIVKDAELMIFIEVHDSYSVAVRSLWIILAKMPSVTISIRVFSEMQFSKRMRYGLAYFLAKQLRQVLSNGFGRQAPVLQHFDFIIFQPYLI